MSEIKGCSFGLSYGFGHTFNTFSLVQTIPFLGKYLSAGTTASPLITCTNSFVLAWFLDSLFEKYNHSKRQTLLPPQNAEKKMTTVAFSINEKVQQILLQ